MLARCMVSGVLLVCFFGGGQQALAIPTCGGPCTHDDSACVQRRVHCLITGGAAKEALAEAKQASARHPKDPRLARLVAHVYLARKNSFWAQRVLMEAISLDEGDCESRGWLAWIQLQEGDLDLAKETLGEGDCPKTAPDGGRWALLAAMMARAEKNTKRFVKKVDQATEAGALYPEDRVLWRGLHRRAHPGFMMPLRLRAEVGLGYTSNINAGLPLTSSADGASRPEISAGMSVADLHAQLVLPWWRLKPALEFGLRGQAIDDFASDRQALDTRDASYLQLSARPGLYLPVGRARLFLGYHADLFFLRGGDRYDGSGLAFFEGHRLEGELERASLTLFWGAGRRIFRQISRARWEIDGGVGYGFSALQGRFNLLMALSLRSYFSEGDAFDATGATVLSAARYVLGKGFYMRASAALGVDFYPEAPRADPLANTLGGADFQLKARLAVWSPAWHGVRAGLRYQFSWRETELQVSFPYRDHRLFFGVRVSFSMNPWEPSVVSPPGHVAFPHGERAAADGMAEERIRDLLRQDEAAQRGSSCVN
ncbi:MAG: hypothetical protein JRH20_23755 [Deltaproteobacteria bacterium]|nr:hypothetical protein [Deltaproteobacteria bacterium]